VLVGLSVSFSPSIASFFESLDSNHNPTRQRYPTITRKVEKSLAVGKVRRIIARFVKTFDVVDYCHIDKCPLVSVYSPVKRASVVPIEELLSRRVSRPSFYPTTPQSHLTTGTPLVPQVVTHSYHPHPFHK
jgi:hypothetical protein